MPLLSIAVDAVLALCLLATPGPGAAGAWHEDSLRVRGIDRWYRVYVPAGLPAGRPVVMLLHGGLQSMRRIMSDQAGGTRAWLDLADRERFLLVTPNGTDFRTGDTRGDRQQWADLRAADIDAPRSVEDVVFLRALLERVRREHASDSTRLYVAGASNGGIMTYRLALEMSDVIAAGAAFVANLPRADAGLVAPARPVPLFICNGTEDRLMPWKGGRIIGNRGEVRSAEETLTWWLRADRAGPSPMTREWLPDRSADDGCRVERSTYAAGANGAPVVFLKVEGGGHGLPSRRYPLPDKWWARFLGPMCRDVEGAELAWEFLAAQRRAP